MPRTRRPSPEAAATGLPKPIDDTLKLALSVTATMMGAHEDCPRRSCRRAGRCHAAAEGAFCQCELTPHGDDIALHMMVFAHRLLQGRR